MNRMSHDNTRLADALAAWEQAKADHAKAWRDPSGSRILEQASRQLEAAFEKQGLSLAQYANRKFAGLSRELVVPLTPRLDHYRGLELLPPGHMLFGYKVDVVQDHLSKARAQHGLPLSPAPSGLTTAWTLAGLINGIRAAAAGFAPDIRPAITQPGYRP